MGRFVKWDSTKIFDRETGLFWEVKTPENVGDVYSWEEADQYIQKLNHESFGGFSTWRLPTIQELVTIVDYSRYSPAIDSIFGPTKPSWYWSSTNLAYHYAYHIPDTWGVNFYSGGVIDFSKNASTHVRAVRESD